MNLAGCNRARRTPRRGVRLIGAIAVAMLPLRSDNVDAQGPPEAWPQWGGPNRNFVLETDGLADSWPPGGPPILWKRPLGTGHSAIVAADGRLYTMYRDGDGRSRSGPWSAEETVIALDAATGDTAWEYSYPSTLEDFSFGSGPHATPLLVGNRLFAAGTNKQLHAFDTRTGRLLWSHDLVADFGAPPLMIRPRVKAGYGCSPLAYRDLVICQVGGPGQSVMAFRQEDGSVAWRSGDFLVSQAPQLLIDVGDQTQLVVFAGQAVHGLDPSTGRIYWSQPHDAGNDFNFMVPLWGPDNVMFVSSGYIAGSQAFRLARDGDHTLVTPLWFNERVKFMFLNPIRLGGHVYGTEGTFGPAFLTAVDLRTGQAVWRERGFARGSLLYADGKGILLDEDGDLALVALTPDGARTLARTTIFHTTAWTAPTLVGTTLYARDREQIMAIDLGRR